MKMKVFAFFSALLLILAMGQSCVSDSQEKQKARQEKAMQPVSPGEFIRNFFIVWSDGNIDQAMEMIHETVGMTGPELERMRQGLQIGHQQLIDDTGGIADIEILHEERNKDGKTASVSYLVYYVNGDKKELTRQLIRHGDQWMVSLK